MTASTGIGKRSEWPYAFVTVVPNSKVYQDLWLISNYEAVGCKPRNP